MKAKVIIRGEEQVIDNVVEIIKSFGPPPERIWYICGRNWGNFVCPECAEEYERKRRYSRIGAHVEPVHCGKRKYTISSRLQMPSTIFIKTEVITKTSRTQSEFMVDELIEVIR